MRIWAFWFLAWGSLCAQVPALDLLNQNKPLLDAHNCYPYSGKWNDRLDRVLSAAHPVGVEQDFAWGIDRATGKGRPVLAHAKETTGGEPSLREYFFEHVRPLVETAIRENERARWPLIVVHFDFKDNRPELLRAVWDLLGEYEAWITTALKTADPRTLAPYDVRPLLVLTGKPTNYRRWWNNSWLTVEEGGQAKAGEWTAADDSRLRALVDHAHRQGFGSRAAALLRWKAAAAAGVNPIAIDQFEDLAKTPQGSQYK